MAFATRFGQVSLMPLIAACLLAPVVAMPAMAGEPQGSARYEMERVDGGFLRLDRQTGDVSHCREIQGAWACQLVPDERKAYEKRIRELEKKNAELRKRLEARGNKDELPSEEELDKAFSFFGAFMDRFTELMRHFRDRMEDMDEPPAGDPHPGDI